jgi:hypothetical protein
VTERRFGWCFRRTVCIVAGTSEDARVSATGGDFLIHLGPASQRFVPVRPVRRESGVVSRDRDIGCRICCGGALLCVCRRGYGERHGQQNAIALHAISCAARG